MDGSRPYPSCPTRPLFSCGESVRTLYLFPLSLEEVVDGGTDFKVVVLTSDTGSYGYKRIHVYYPSRRRRNTLRKENITNMYTCLQILQSLPTLNPLEDQEGRSLFEIQLSILCVFTVSVLTQPYRHSLLPIESEKFERNEYYRGLKGVS